MPENCFIGIDTSNYTTSAAVCTESGRVIANLKAPLPVKPGECGLRQSDAVFAHVKNLPALLDRLGDELRERDCKPVAVGVSAKPRDAADSYMPCFLSGVAAAHAFASGREIPVYEFSHQNGHVMAALYSADVPFDFTNEAFGAFHVSGGTTEMLYVSPRGQDFSVTLCGGSADLHAGQAIDRVGVRLGLSFPCGPALEELAFANTAKIPKPKIAVKGGECHLSGLENLSLSLFEKSGDRALTAAYLLRFITETLIAMATHLRAEKGDLPLVFAGGVMSNRIIAKEIAARLPSVYFAEPAFSADNAAGISLLCWRKHLKI